MNPDSNPTPEASLWLYSHEGTTLGPCSFDELQALLTAGDITSETLVAKEGSEDWRPLSAHLPPAKSAAPATPPPLTSKEKRDAVFGCLVMIVLVALLVVGVKSCFFGQREIEYTGISYDQILSNGLGESFKMERVEDMDGRRCYMGKSNSSPPAILQIRGDKADVFKSSLMVTVPEDSPVGRVKSQSMAMRFLANLDPAWPEAEQVQWFANALEAVIVGREEKVIKQRAGNRITVTVVSGAVVLSVQNRFYK